MGGLTFMLRGKMCCGIIKDELMARVIRERYDEAISNRHARAMDFTGRVLKGFVLVDEAGYRKQSDLNYWIEMGIEFIELNPDKKPAKKPAKKSTPRKKR